uniref:Uncharacterized protein n=1 Tax=Anguilla anguilla TaxID=7936 RepID=A0A0E9W5Y4_ANGAN
MNLGDTERKRNRKACMALNVLQLSCAVTPLLPIPVIDSHLQCCIIIG